MSSGEYVSESELEAIVRELEGLAAQVSSGVGWAEVENAVWRLYVRVEILVTKMKLRMGVERPGQFIEVVQREPMSEHVPAAFAAVQKGRENVKARRYEDALESLRECRNELRTFLDSARKARLRQVRKSRIRGPASSPVSSPPS